jgi:hypothetical protein
MGVMSGSLRSQPRRIRATRRARFPVVRARRPHPGRHHPASASDVRKALKAFGEEVYYGVESVELVPGPTAGGRLSFGRLLGPGRIVLYDQAPSPWRRGHPLGAAQRKELEAGGADLSAEGVVSWPNGALRRFMLGYVLAHELGHHVLQHERRLRGQRGARTREHEARAAARRHKNPLRVHRATISDAARYEEVLLLVPAGPGISLHRARLTHGHRQLTVVGASPDEVARQAADRLQIASLGLEPVDSPPLRLVASIAPAETARQVGRRRAAPGSPRRAPSYEKAIELAPGRELVVIEQSDLLDF